MNWLSKLLGEGEREPPRTLDEWLAEARSHNGYVREAAVKALGRSGQGRALPMLLERANDWVPEVRHAARQAVGVFLQDGSIGPWVCVLGQVAALRRASRADHSALLQGIEALLLRPGHLLALHAVQDEMTPEALRFLFDLQIRAVADDDVRSQVLQRALASRDVVVASMGVAAIQALHAPARRLALAGEACLSRFAAVRANGLRVALSSGGPVAASLAADLCLDTSAGVRVIALAALAGSTGSVVDRARHLFQQGSRVRERAAALDVLCTLDPGGARALCELASSDSASTVRRMAYIRRLAGAQGAERDELVLLVLKDESPRVRSVAVAQVGQGAAAPSGDTLLGLARARPVALGSLVSVAVRLPPWERLVFLLDALQDLAQDDAVAGRLHEALECWSRDMAKSFVSPTQEQRPRVSQRWALMRDGLPMSVQKQIAFHLQTFGLL